MKTSVADIRKDYKQHSLNESDIASDPFVQFEHWWQDAVNSEIDEVNAMTLATATKQGVPSARIVLLKGYDPQGFVFFTNYSSKKAKEAFLKNKVAFNLHWKSLRRQIRVRGYVEKEDGIIADKYFSERQIGSKTAAWASIQSETLSNREELIERWQTYQNKYKENVTRPNFWGWIRIKPIEIEFWADGQYRLNDRFVWKRGVGEKTWNVRRLYP